MHFAALSLVPLETIPLTATCSLLLILIFHMVQQIVEQIGRGQKYPTLADWARALPADLVARGLIREKPRKPAKPSRREKEKRLADKARRARLKQSRSKPGDSAD